MQTTTERSDIDYDATLIASSTLRRRVESALATLRLRRREDLWGALLRDCRQYPSARTLLIADLTRVASDERFTCLAGGPPSLSVVFVARTRRDRELLSEPAIALRLNHEKFSLVQVEQQTGPGEIADAVRRHCLAVIESMQPDRVREARFSALDETLWLEFGDGLQRAVRWSTLPFAVHLDLTPTSASVREHGEAVVLADARGRQADIDAEVLRTAVDTAFGTARDRRDHTERAATGARIRAIREERGLSQEQVQALTGISQETLSRIENGHRDPRLHTLRKLAAGLSMDLPELLAQLAGSRHE